MQVFKCGFLVLASVVFVTGNVFAQTTDYNDALKAQLKAEDAPVTPPKKVVHKKIHKSDSQSAKIAAQKKAMAKSVKVAQTEPSVTTVNVETVRTKTVQPANDENLEAPALGSSAVAVPQQVAAQPYQPIFILQPTQAPAQAAPVQAAAVAPQVQPTTNIDSTSVPEPRSEQLRRQREDLEHQTESKLIEKLEDDRLNSEKDRANKIFASPTPAATPANNAADAAPVIAPVTVGQGATGASTPGPVTAVEVAAPEQAVSAVAPAATAAVAPVAPQVQIESVKNDATPVAAPALVGETKAQNDANAVAKPEDEKRFSVGALGGLPSYPSVGNISSYYAIGAMANYKFAEHLAVEGEFDYSKYDIKNLYYCPFCFGGTLVKGLDQYDVSLGLNYMPFKFSSLTPIAGVVLDFARRNYYDRVDYGYTYGTPTGSNAFNAGLKLGLDLNITPSIILGAQFSYLWNISYWTDDPLAYGLYGPIYGSPIESLSYYLATLNIRFMF